MAHRYDHLREKAVQLRTEQRLTLNEIIERLSLPRGTIYHWIKDLPAPPRRQGVGQQQGTRAMQAKFAALRDAAYAQGLAEAPLLLQDLSFRDFVVLYMAEGSKKNRNSVEFVNSNAELVRLAHRWIASMTMNKIGYTLQYHVDHDADQLKQYWAGILGIQADIIVLKRKSNSNRLSGRQFRSVHGLLSVRVGDTYLRARLQGWMDYVQAQW
jgi:hypothetical protein